MKDLKCKNKDCENMINSKCNKTGLCTKCSTKQYRAKYLKDNQERLRVKYRARRRKYQVENKEFVSNYHRNHYQKNKDEFKANSKDYYDNNKEKVAKYSLEYYHRRYKEDEGFRMRKLLGHALNRVISYYIKTGKISKLMPKYNIDWAGIMKVLTPIPQPRSAYDVDHIIPLYKFDLTDYEQIHLAFAPENHRWLTKKENQKRDRPKN